jgi:hypothetical protein
MPWDCSLEAAEISATRSAIFLELEDTSVKAALVLSASPVPSFKFACLKRILMYFVRFGSPIATYPMMVVHSEIFQVFVPGTLL